MADYAPVFSQCERTKRRKIEASVKEHICSVVLDSTLDNMFESDGTDVQFNSFSTSQSVSTLTCADHEYVIVDNVAGLNEDNTFDSCIDIDDEPLFNDRLTNANDRLTSQSDSSNSDSCDDMLTSESLKSRLADWAVSFNVSQSAVSALLTILKDCDLDLPKDARTLLATPRDNTEVKCIAGGSYYYFGVANSLRCQLKALSPALDDLASLTLHFNVDGLPLFRSSNMQLWPILGMVAEAYKKEPFLISIFSGSCKPKSLDDFLGDFVNEMKMLLLQGLDYNGHHYAINIGSFICDTPARSFMKCTKGHSGYNSCERCTQEGVHVDGRMTFPLFDGTARTDEQFKDMLSEDHHTGVSPLVDLGVGCVTQFVLDYMHLVCLGVMRRLILLWIKGPLKTRLPNMLVQQISADLLSLKGHMPRTFSRKPRSLAEVLQWKATEFRQFLLYTGPVVLLGKLDKCMYRNFMLLSVSMMILLSPSLCEQNCAYAQQLITTFVKNFALIYGNNLLVYNVHSLLHLPDDAKKFGPLDNVSAFPFENFLGRLKKIVRKAHNPVAQIVKRIEEAQHVVKSASSACSIPHVKRPHTNGPVPPGMAISSQYSLCVRNDEIISCSNGENCFEILGQIAVIRNILMSHKEQIFIVYEVYRNVDPFFHYPLNSSAVGIHSVSKPSGQLLVCSVEDIGKKYVAMPYKQTTVVIPLLHN